MVASSLTNVSYASCLRNSLSQQDRSSVLEGMAMDTLGGASPNLPAQLRVQAEPMTQATAFHEIDLMPGKFGSASGVLIGTLFV